MSPRAPLHGSPQSSAFPVPGSARAPTPQWRRQAWSLPRGRRPRSGAWVCGLPLRSGNFQQMGREGRGAGRSAAPGQPGRAQGRAASQPGSPQPEPVRCPHGGSWKKFKGNGYIGHRGSPGDGRGRCPGHCARLCSAESLGAPGSARHPHTGTAPTGGGRAAGLPAQPPSPHPPSSGARGLRGLWPQRLLGRGE